MTTLSVVIPTWSEAGRIGALVTAAHGWADEVLVADGGSPDGTAAIAAAHGARVVEAPRGRGLQLAAAAREARGDVLWFLHADVEVRGDPRAAILAALADPAVLGGNFFLRFSPEDGWSRVFTWANDVRRRALRIYYGDSGVFVRRSVYEQLGGFPDLAVFEDYAFVRRLERQGPTAYIRHVELHASDRRFADAPMRTLLLWAAMQTLYSGGVPASRLARLYADIR